MLSGNKLLEAYFHKYNILVAYFRKYLPDRDSSQATQPLLSTLCQKMCEMSWNLLALLLECNLDSFMTSACP